jgi:hypothetical protein
MFRVRLILAIAAIATAPALAGCSGSSLTTYVPDWLLFKPSPPPSQAVQFESQPPGAEVRTAGQTCVTPCSLALPVTSQSVTIALNGFVPQTVQVEAGPSGDLVPNPVDVALQAAAPIRPVRKPPRKKPPPRTAARPAAEPPPPAPAPVENTPGYSTPLQQPSVQPPPSSPFPPPPPR